MGAASLSEISAFLGYGLIVNNPISFNFDAPFSLIIGILSSLWYGGLWKTVFGPRVSRVKWRTTILSTSGEDFNQMEQLL